MRGSFLKQQVFTRQTAWSLMGLLAGLVFGALLEQSSAPALARVVYVALFLGGTAIFLAYLERTPSHPWLYITAPLVWTRLIMLIFGTYWGYAWAHHAIAKNPGFYICTALSHATLIILNMYRGSDTTTDARPLPPA